MTKLKLNQVPRFCILGAGNGGQAMAAYLSLMGFKVHLYNRSPERIEPLQIGRELELICNESDGVPTGRARLEVMTTDIEEALEGVDVLMVTTTANGHAFIAEHCAPHLQDGQIVILNPGRTGGALEFHNVLRKRGVTTDVVVAEAGTFLYACRLTNPGQVRIFRIKNTVPVAAIPAYRTPDVVKVLRMAFPQFAPADNVMKTSLGNIGAIFHPAITILSAARIESTHGAFDYYIEGVTPSTARILEALDAERVAVSEAMGFRCLTARHWLYVSYSAAGSNLYEAIQANPGYGGIKAPRNLNHRYLHEDVPMSLVPIVSLGKMFHVETPTMCSIVELASLMSERNYWTIGRTVERLGIAGLNLQQVRQLVLEGKVLSNRREVAKEIREE